MNVLIFGATGMVGQSVLRECLLDPAVTSVKTIGRTPTGQQHPKLQEIHHADLFNYAGVKHALTGIDACFFCIGISVVGLTEAEYTRANHDMPLAAADTLARLNPQMTFVYVSAAGADSTENGRLMWARVRGKTENTLLAMPFKAAYMFRPGGIQPLHGVQSKTASYRRLYALTKPLLPLVHKLFPNLLITSEQLGRAMLRAAKEGAPKRVLESVDINQLG